MKPNIKPKSKIGKNKFEDFLINDPFISKKEIAVLSEPKKITDVSLERKRDYVNQDAAKIGQLLNEYFIKHKKDPVNRTQLLHTHLIFKNPKKYEFGIALPSMSDIMSIINYKRKFSHKYEIIAVISPKTGKPIGYTTLKFEKLNTTFEKFNEVMKRHMTPKNKKTAEYKKYLFLILPKIGIEVYFTPENGYKLDKNFNFIPDKK